MSPCYSLRAKLFVRENALMDINTVAILSPGDMGHAVGQRLRENELDVITCLTGRSDRTRALSRKAGIRDVATVEELVEQSNLILSMTVSGAVPGVCQQVADALAAAGSGTLFAECNAISPQLARDLEPIITDAGGRFVDVSIIGGPPRPGYSPHFYASGQHAAQFEQLNDFGLTVLKLDGAVGQASGIKMCYAAMTKGSWALYTQLLMAAELMGLTEPLLAEFGFRPAGGVAAHGTHHTHGAATLAPLGQRDGRNPRYLRGTGYDAAIVRRGHGDVPVHW